ncbi:MAG: hypothetical protein JW827_03815, partial [Spirochaetes bacterium]|nr:hypothetical protein [Spirochaetota bacterium]
MYIFIQSMKRFSIIILFLSFFLELPSLYSAIYYVKTNGNNSSTGLSWVQAWKTISHAASNVVFSDIVNVSNGIYNEKVFVSNSGSPGNYITFRSYNPHGTVLDGTGFSYAFFVTNRNYIRIQDFIIRKADRAGVYITGSSTNNIITNNIICSNITYAGILLNGDNVD